MNKCSGCTSLKIKVFSADAKIFLEKIKKYFAHKKLHTYNSWEFFSLCSPNCQKLPRPSFPFYKFFYTTISAKISEWEQFIPHIEQPLYYHMYSLWAFPNIIMTSNTSFALEVLRVMQVHNAESQSPTCTVFTSTNSTWTNFQKAFLKFMQVGDFVGNLCYFSWFN